MNTTAHSRRTEEVMAFLEGETPRRQCASRVAHSPVRGCTALAAQFRGTSESLSGWENPALPTKVEKHPLELAATDTSACKAAKPTSSFGQLLDMEEVDGLDLGNGGAALLLRIAIILQIRCVQAWRQTMRCP